MPKVGRNDPCPCGSGKKYKHCCMRREQFSASRELTLNAQEGFLLNKLYDYGQSSQFASDVERAFQVYWGALYDLRGAAELGRDETRRTLDWFVHDYRLDDEGHRLLDRFIETQAADYPPEVKELLAAWQSALMGLFRVVELGPGERLGLYDCLRQENLAVHDAVLVRMAQRGDLVIGRLFELGGVKRLGYTTMLLPGAFEDELVTYVMNAYQRYVGEHYQATLDDFLRAYARIFYAFLLSPQAEALRSLIGPGTRFSDPAAARDRWRAATERLAVERREAEIEEPELPEHRTSAGIILPGAAPQREPEKPGETPARPTILLPGRDF